MKETDLTMYVNNATYVDYLDRLIYRAYGCFSEETSEEDND